MSNNNPQNHINNLPSKFLGVLTVAAMVGASFAGALDYTAHASSVKNGPSKTPISNYCVTKTPTVYAGEKATFKSDLKVNPDRPVTFSWEAEGAAVKSGKGSTFSTKYHSPGTYTVVLNVETPLYLGHVPTFYDVTGNGYVTEEDAQTVINYLNAGGTGGTLPQLTGSRWQNQNNPLQVRQRGVFGDTVIEEQITPMDALLIINFLNDSHLGPMKLSAKCAVKVIDKKPAPQPWFSFGQLFQSQKSWTQSSSPVSMQQQGQIDLWGPFNSHSTTGGIQSLQGDGPGQFQQQQGMKTSLSFFSPVFSWNPLRW